MILFYVICITVCFMILSDRLFYFITYDIVTFFIVLCSYLLFHMFHCFSIIEGRRFLVHNILRHMAF